MGKKISGNFQRHFTYKITQTHFENTIDGSDEEGDANQPKREKSNEKLCREYTEYISPNYGFERHEKKL